MYQLASSPEAASPSMPVRYCPCSNQTQNGSPGNAISMEQCAFKSSSIAVVSPGTETSTGCRASRWKMRVSARIVFISTRVMVSLMGIRPKRMALVLRHRSPLRYDNDYRAMAILVSIAGFGIHVNRTFRAGEIRRHVLESWWRCVLGDNRYAFANRRFVPFNSRVAAVAKSDRRAVLMASAASSPTLLEGIKGSGVFDRGRRFGGWGQDTQQLKRWRPAEHMKSLPRAPRAATNSARTARRRPCLNRPEAADRDAASSSTPAPAPHPAPGPPPSPSASAPASTGPSSRG